MLRNAEKMVADTQNADTNREFKELPKLCYLWTKYENALLFISFVIPSMLVYTVLEFVLLF